MYTTKRAQKGCLVKYVAIRNTVSQLHDSALHVSPALLVTGAITSPLPASDLRSSVLTARDSDVTALTRSGGAISVAPRYSPHLPSVTPGAPRRSYLSHPRTPGLADKIEQIKREKEIEEPGDNGEQEIVLGL
ncbi:hypothetical protein E2C01_011784 [Portunus trituberculatus]|uniref:Uncharacterized protein n=1 Tax=Portunus trituberculatus TaxID=210409 RepID=A0A5B7DCF0_PORTR|nr:hypothetical protein [Portunus trituberculatus]